MVTSNKQTSELNIRQDTFAKQYARTGNATESYRLAGYTVNTPQTAEVNGSKLLRNTKVKAAIERYREDIAAANTVDRNYVIRRLRHFAEEADTDAVAVRATELLGKTLRMFVDVSENTVTHDVQALQEFTIEQLAAMREQAALRSPEPVEDVIDVDSREVT